MFGPKMKKSFKQWCDENNRQDLLDRWDYEETGYTPDEISYASAKPVYFKCPCGKHKSEKRKVHVITSGSQHDFICKECNKEWNRQLDDLTGKTFGELTVIKYDEDRSKNSKQTYWICKCSCGKVKSIGAIPLKRGTQITCGDRKIHWSGEKSTRWKGGVTPINTSIRNSTEYDEWRQNILKKDNYKCVVCGKDKKLEVHHIYPFSDYPEYRFDINKACTLCYAHHSMYEEGSFHKEYGTYHNTPEQLEEYVNRKRQELGIVEPFNINNYMKPDMIQNMTLTSSLEDEKLEIEYPLIDFYEELEA